MKISEILIEDKIKEKILYKHNIRASEIREALLNNPLVLKISNNRYIGIGNAQSVITVIFEMIKNTAFIITSYSSSDAQRKLYKRKRG